MKLHFDKAHIQRLIILEKTLPPRPQPYTEKEPEHGLVLVGDQGVYFMQNGKAELPDSGRYDVCYAEECNPDTLSFDAWWHVKNDSFGGDDGAEFFPLEQIEQWAAQTKGDTMRMELTPLKMALMA